ncbi:NUDIX domain-containing protein [Candidatus Bipolaricaulota bacterium]|nr:NUDIX domain-containing protein [Candidatus Bipolaricaulota bacterium]
MDRKVFLYVLRKRHERREILAFESHDEAGSEVPKGSVEPGETLVEAVRRELREEAGLHTANEPEPISTTIWRDEEQTFFRVEGSDAALDRFGHMVAGTGIDASLVYRYE